VKADGALRTTGTSAVPAASPTLVFAPSQATVGADVLVGVAVAPFVGVDVGVAVALPLPDGPGIAALSSRMASTVASTAVLLVAPIRTSVTGLLIVSLGLLANAVPKAASPVAKYPCSTPFPLPLAWRMPIR